MLNMGEEPNVDKTNDGEKTATASATADEEEEPFDLQGKLEKRLKMARDTRDALQIKVKHMQADLQKMFQKIPKRPRESTAELQEKIDQLEYQRTTTSLDLAQERSILREIAALKRTCAQWDDFAQHDESVKHVKSQLSTLRIALDETHTTVSELEKGITKVQLAKQYRCLPQEIHRLEMAVPAERVGMVIGKQGSMMKKVMETAQVHIDVVEKNIIIQGPQSHIDKAVTEIDRIALAVEERVKVSEEMIIYLTAKHVTAWKELQQRHEQVYMDVTRNSTFVSLRGLPEPMQAAKEDVLKMQNHLTRVARTFTPKESSVLLGRKGSTVDKLVSEFQAAVDLEKKPSPSKAEKTHALSNNKILVVVGPSQNVHNLLGEMERLMQTQKEVTHAIATTLKFRRCLLMDSGTRLKQIQASVLSQLSNKATTPGPHLLSLSMEEDEPAQANPHQQDVHAVTHVLLKTRAMDLELVIQLVRQALEKLASGLVEWDVDPFVIPKLIGKGGETIKQLQGKHVLLLLDRKNGKLAMYSNKLSELQTTMKKVRKLLDDNQVCRVKLGDGDNNNNSGGGTYGQSVLREIQKSHKKEIVQELNCFLDADDTKAELVVRGTPDNIKKAEKIIKEFLKSNFLQQVPITAEDEAVLLMGRGDSMIEQLSKEWNVTLSADRARYVVIVRGTRDKVNVAVKKLQRFLHGGEGHAVQRITVTEQALGVVIGKGGRKRQALEKNHPGVTISIHHNSRITLRGQQELVDACRVEILTLVSSLRIHQTVSITPEQHANFENASSKAANTLKRIAQSIPVQMNLSERSSDAHIKVRGFYPDVRDAVSLLQEFLTGHYQTSVELDACQWTRVRNDNSSHFARMEEAAPGTKIELDLQDGSIRISGHPRHAVKKAKQLVMQFLEFLLPSELEIIKLAKPLHSTIAQATSLGDIMAKTGACVYLDRDLNAVVIRSSQFHKVQQASEILQAKLKQAQTKLHVEQFEATDAWILNALLQRHGAQLQRLKRETQCDVHVNKEERTITVSVKQQQHQNDEGNSNANNHKNVEAMIRRGRETIQAWVEQVRRESVLVSFPEAALPAFVGKAGSHINNFAKKHSVEMNRVRKDASQVRIQACDEATAVAAKRACMEWLEQWKMQQEGTRLELAVHTIAPVQSAASLIGREFHCKLEFDETSVTIRGGTAEQQQGAVDKIRAIAKSVVPEASHATATAADNHVGLTIVDGSPKSRRRLRRQDMSDDSTIQVGTSAGRNLYSLLVSEPASTEHDAPEVQPAKGVSLMVSGDEEQWDSSTVSSAAVSATDDESGTSQPRNNNNSPQHDNNGSNNNSNSESNAISNNSNGNSNKDNQDNKNNKKNSNESKPYYKSASGFAVRV